MAIKLLLIGYCLKEQINFKNLTLTDSYLRKQVPLEWVLVTRCQPSPGGVWQGPPRAEQEQEKDAGGFHLPETYPLCHTQDTCLFCQNWSRWQRENGGQLSTVFHLLPAWAIVSESNAAGIFPEFLRIQASPHLSSRKYFILSRRLDFYVCQAKASFSRRQPDWHIFTPTEFQIKSKSKQNATVADPHKRKSMTGSSAVLRADSKSCTLCRLCFYSSMEGDVLNIPDSHTGLLALRQEGCLYSQLSLLLYLLNSAQNQYRKGGTLLMCQKEKQQIHMISFLEKSSSSLEMHLDPGMGILERWEPFFYFLSWYSPCLSICRKFLWVHFK